MNASMLKNLQRILIEPLYDSDSGTLRKSRLLSAFLLVMIIVFAGLDMFSIRTIPGYVIPWYGYVFLLTAYALNRKRYYKISAQLVALMFPVTIFSAILMGEANTPTVSLGFLVLGLIVGSILLTQGSVMLLAVGNTIGILLLPRLIPQIVPDFSSIITPLAIFSIGAALVLISMRHRDQIEEDRQRELRASEAQYRMLIEESPTGIQIFDADNTGYRIMAVNPAGCEILGYPHDELIGMKVNKLIDPDELTRQSVPSPEEMQSGKTIRRERIFTRKDGARVSVLGGFKQMPDGRFLYIFQDITERKKAEEKLKQFRQVMDESNDAIFFIDPATGRYIDFNQTALNYLQYSRDELAELSVIQIAQHIHDLADWHERVALVEREGGLIFESVYQRKDKTTFPVEVSARMLEYGDKTIMAAVVRDITERKRADEELRRNEEKFRQLITSAPDAIIGANQEGKIMFASMEATKLLGYELEELLNMNIEALMPARFRAAHTAKYADYMTNPHPRMRAGLELFAKRKDDSEVPVDISLSRLDTEAGALVTAFIRDVTERKRAEDALRESQNRLSLFFNQSLDGFYFSMLDEPMEWNDSSNKEKTIDYVLTHQRITEVNDAMVKQYGANRENFLGRTASDFFAHDLEQARQFRKNLFDAGHLHLETEERKDDGTPIWIEGDYVCMYDNQNRITGQFGIQRDVTERKRAEEALRESEERFRKIFHSSPVAICITTLKGGRLLDGNYAYWELSGYDPKTSIGKDYIELKMWDNPQDRVQFVENIARNHSHFNPDYVFRDAKGNQKFAIAFYELIHIGDEDCILSMYYDVTDQKKMQETLRQSEERYRLISSLSADYVFSSKLKRDGTIDEEWTSGAFEVITGYTLEEVNAVGGWRMIVHPDDLGIDDKALEKLHANQTAIQEIRIIMKSGETRWLKEYVHPVWDEQENRLVGIYGAVQNIDDRKRAEEEILQLNVELEDRVQERTAQLHEANQNLHQEKMRLEGYTRQRELMGTMTDLLQASLTTDEASEIVSSHFKLLFPKRDGALYLLNATGTLEPIAVWGEQKSLDTMFGINECWALRRGKPYRFGRGLPNPSCAHVGKDVPPHALCIPLSAQGESLGSLHISTQSVEDIEMIDDEEQRFIETIADSVALALANLRLRERLRIQSIRDGLTGLFNRRYLDETLPREIHRAERSQRPISVLMFDIDGFKKFNDTYGHDAGDIVLKRIAETVLANIRSSDIACRYGGEEFTIVLPDTSLDVAYTRGETLREAASKMSIQHNGRDLGHVTISLGVAAYPQHGMTRDILIKSADKASYQAKEAGKNRVIVASSTMD